MMLLLVFSFICKKWLYSFPNLFIFRSIFNNKGIKMMLEYLRNSYVSAYTNINFQYLFPYCTYFLS